MMNCKIQQTILQSTRFRARDACVPDSWCTEEALLDIPTKCPELSSVQKGIAPSQHQPHRLRIEVPQDNNYNSSLLTYMHSQLAYMQDFHMLSSHPNNTVWLRTLMHFTWALRFTTEGANPAAAGWKKCKLQEEGPRASMASQCATLHSASLDL